MKSVVFSQNSRISCACEQNAAVILCLVDSGLLATPGTYLAGTLVNVYSGGCTCGCGGSTRCSNNEYRYVISYDESLLADPTTPLVDTNVNKVFCSNCETHYLPLTVNNSGSINLDLENNNLGADVRISSNAGNILIEDGDGMYVPTSSVLTTTNSSSVELDLVSNNLEGAVLISPAAGNVLTQAYNGLYVPTPTAITVTDTPSVDLTFSSNNLTAAVKRSAVTGNILAEQSDGLYVAPGAFGTVTDTASVDLTLSGGGDLQAAVKRSATAGNILAQNGDGLYVPTPTAITVTDTNSIDLGVTGSNITASSKISATTGNAISIAADGLYVAGAALTSKYIPLYANPVAVSNAASSATPLRSFTVPANTLTTLGQCLYVRAAGTIVAGAVATNLLALEGFTILSAHTTIASANNWIIEGRIWYVGALSIRAEITATYSVTTGTPDASSVSNEYVTSLAIDPTTSRDIAFAISDTVAAQVTITSFAITLIGAP